MAISTRMSRSPVTRSAQSPLTVDCPSSSSPSSRKNAIVAGRSSTTMPTLSICFTAIAAPSPCFSNLRRGFRAQPDRRLCEHFAVPDAECADPALPARDVADERAELHELRLGEVRVQLVPQRVVGERGVPADRVGVAERHALALREERRRLVGVEACQLVLGGGLLSRPDSALVASVVALERLRHAQTAELFQVQVNDPALEEPLPGVEERAQNLRLARTDRLDLGSRRAVQHRVLERGAQLGIVELLGI